MNKQELFGAIAQLAMEQGYEIVLEDKHIDYKSKTLGNLANIESLDTGVVLRAYPPGKDEEEDEEADGD